MGTFNEILQPRYNQLLTRLLAMKGQAPAPQVASEIMAVLSLEEDRLEWYVPAGATPWWGFVDEGANVGNFGGVGVRNPINSGLLVTVTHAQIAGATTALAPIFQRTPNSGVNSIVGTFGRDSRRQFGAAGLPNIITYLGVAQATGFVGPVWFAAVNGVGTETSTTQWPGVVLVPDSEFIVSTPAQNIEIIGAFAGYQRSITAEELKA